jgi:hypothetical protein
MWAGSVGNALQVVGSRISRTGTTTTTTTATAATTTVFFSDYLTNE